MDDRQLTVADIGEKGLLQQLQAFCPPEIIGDDGAIIEVADQKSLVVTTDVLVDGVHFSDRTMPPEAVGWRAAAANLSDLAAMGAQPLGITVGLSIPGTQPVSWVEQLYQGLVNCLRQFQTPIIGGDVTRSPVVTLSITALGHVSSHQAIRRNQAQVGDGILVTGEHGNSRAGLELLLHPETGQSLTPQAQQKLIQAHQRPQPRLDVIQTLAQARETRAIAGMDSSDGLADALIQLCRSSQVGAVIDIEQIPIAPVLPQWQGPELALQWAFYGGEDFELVLCLPRPTAARLVETLEGQAALIGEITTDTTINLLNAPTSLPPTLEQHQGFQHFKP